MSELNSGLVLEVIQALAPVGLSQKQTEQARRALARRFSDRMYTSWSIDDVMTAAEELRVKRKMTRSRCRRVLFHLGRYQSAGLGTTWGSVRDSIKAVLSADGVYGQPRSPR